MLRWIIGLPLAGLITALLFLVMAKLIAPQEIIDTVPEPRAPIDITFTPPPPGGPDTPEQKPLPDPPEPVDIDLPEKSGLPTAGDGTYGPPQGPGEGTGPTGDPIRIPPPDITSPPPYPQGCVSKGAEGVVVVEFDVDPRGNVINPRIISSPDRCFDRPIMKAVEGWKYSPNFDNGEPVMRRNVRETLRFTLEDPD